MAKYKVTAATWNGHDEGFIVTDPDVRQEDLDVLVHIGVLALVDEDSDYDPPLHAFVTPSFTAPTPEEGVADNGDLSQ